MRFNSLFCFILLLVSLASFSQSNDIRFRRVSPPGGFSFQAIQSFNQDKYGYMWMGGFDGVIRYDSKDIIRFTHNPENKDGLPSNTITSIAIDKGNNIWVSTNNGLCLYNHTTQEFKRFYYTYENGAEPNNNLSSMQIDGMGRLWIADELFLGYLDEKEKKLIRITTGLDDAPRLLYNDGTNHLWLGTLNGSVYSVLADENRVTKRIDGPGSLARTICTDNEDIWVGYESHGARLYDLQGNLKFHYTYPTHPEYDIKSASIRKIIRDTRGRIWIGSYLGLFQTTGAQLNHYNIDEYEGLPHNSIYDVFEDQQGGIWIGTWSGGVSYIHHADNTFNNFRESKAPGSISDNMVSSFAQTKNGDLFVGTEQGGLNKFNRLTSSFSEIPALKNEGVLDVKALEVDKYDGLWVACAFKGVYYRPKGQEEFIHFEEGEEDGKHVSAKGVYALCKCDSGIWMGTNFGGINFYNFNTKKISFKIEAPFSRVFNLNIRSLSIDSNDNLWVTTTNGTFQIHIPSGTLTHFNTSSSNSQRTNSQYFYFASELSDGNIWLGTGGNGVNIYNPTSDELKIFEANGLLEGKDVYGIIESQNNDLWITSNDGLILYNTEDESSRRFVITDGIQGNLFNPNAIFKDRDGNLYFGGTNGFSMLESKTMKTNERLPNIFINNIVINNKKIIPTQTDINQFEQLVLGHDETTLNFNFSADNYLLPEKNKFMYRLTNYVDNWVADANNGTATFVNIPPGTYVFEAKACNNDGQWNHIPAQISIRIKQIWYKSTVALILYALLFFIIVLLIVQFYLERLNLKKALLIEKIQHEKEEQLNEMKLRFFTNISHEFRTPLTLINGPIKNLLKAENLTANQHKQLDTVKRNTMRLLQLINQIMDLRKAEKGLEKLDISRIDAVHFINERILNFSEEARAKNINLSFDSSISSCILEADEEKLDKIIFNLLSNAFKFTPLNGTITVTIAHNTHAHTNSKNFSNQLSFGELDNEDVVEISVLDNGPGISGEDLPNIFDRFEQGKSVKTKANSTGIGLNLCKDYTIMHRGAIVVQSTVGKGTCFSIKLPTKQKAQKIMYQSHEGVKNIESWEHSGTVLKQPQAEEKEITILVVEDNRDLREYIISLIQEYFTVLFAENGKSGLDILQSNNVNLIISDVMMPKMDGFEFCQTVKSQIETSHIPVILLTALSSSENTATGLDKGADAYISKPFDEKVLLSQINNLLVQRKRLQESYAQKFVSKQPIDVGSLDNYFLNKINSIVETNFTNENFTVDLLASEMGLSRSQLHRKLKQISNHSSSEYITMVKIKKATALLESKNYTIDEIAFKVGFNSHSYFSKCFKKIHGLTPKEYAKSL